MGNESSGLSGCTLGEHVQESTGCGWSLHPAAKKDGSRVSVFVYEINEETKLFMRNCSLYLKTLRHPAIVRYMDKYKVTSDIYIVTETIKPLESVLDSLSPAEVCAGLYNILEALVFMHERGGVCHNNVCMSSVYVSSDGSWKLGGMDLACKFVDASKEYLKELHSVRDPQSVSPEEKAGGEFPANTEYARDVYAFGILAEQLLETLNELGGITKTFELRIQDELLHADPSRRPQLKVLLGDRLFSNEFLEIVNFLKNITMKTEEEKETFFKSILVKLQQLPEDLIGSRLVEPLLSRFVLLEETAVKELIPHLLTPRHKTKKSHEDPDIIPVLCERLYRAHVIPTVYKIFHVHDTHIRLILLDHFHSYVHLFDKESLKTVLLPQIRLGCYDTNDLLVEKSLCALAELVHILGGDQVIGCERRRNFSEGKPKKNNGSQQIVGDVPCPFKSSLKKSNGAVGHSSPNKEDRQLEREKRREEAKRRREELRQSREERKKMSSTVKTTVSEDSVPANENGLLESESVIEDQLRSETLAENARNTPDSPPVDNSADGNEGTPDWSDWEDEEAGSEMQSVDSELDREIENELTTMESPSSVAKHAPNVDWSDVSNKKSSPHKSKSYETKGALKLLTSKHKDPVETTVESPTDDFDTWGNNDWADDTTVPASPSQTLSPRSHKSKSSALKLKSNKPASASHNQGLGAEFDIMSIDVKKVPQKEEDFFADMIPDIKSHVDLPACAKTNKIDEKTVEQLPVSFAVMEGNDEDTVGGQWDEEGGWGDDDDW